MLFRFSAILSKFGKKVDFWMNICELLNKAISGINDKSHDEQNKLNDDLKSINDLIKDKIWIKKNY